MRSFLFFFLIGLRFLGASPVPHLSDKHELCRTGAGPLKVNVGLEIISITEVNEPDEKFGMHGILHLKWQDPLNVFDPNETGCDPVIFEEDAAREALSKIWWPDPDFRNELHRPELENQLLTMHSDGKAHLKMMIKASLRYRPDLHQFPFDDQKLDLILEPFGFDKNEVVFRVDSNKSGYQNEAMPVDWHLNNMKYIEREAREFHHKEKKSQVVFRIDASRKGDFYIWRLLVPMVLIVMVTWTVFWMVGENLNDRIKVIAIGMLSAISFAHFLGKEMPDIPYLTFLDTIFIGSLVIVFFSVIESLISYNYAKKDMLNKAHRIDVIFRFLMPLIYFVMMYSIYEMYF